MDAHNSSHISPNFLNPTPFSQPHLPRFFSPAPFPPVSPIFLLLCDVAHDAPNPGTSSHCASTVQTRIFLKHEYFEKIKRSNIYHHCGGGGGAGPPPPLKRSPCCRPMRPTTGATALARPSHTRHAPRLPRVVDRPHGARLLAVGRGYAGGAAAPHALLHAVSGSVLGQRHVARHQCRAAAGDPQRRRVGDPQDGQSGARGRPLIPCAVVCVSALRASSLGAVGDCRSLALGHIHIPLGRCHGIP